MQTLPLSETELRAWLRLVSLRGLKPAALRTLLARFGVPVGLFGQPFQALERATDTATARAVLAPPDPALDSYLQRVLAWRTVAGHHIVTLDDPVYPPLLLTMPDPPPLLYAIGHLALLHARSVAIVGSRDATPQGVEDATRFARVLSGTGLAVVSGLALGIDAAAHRGGLAGRGSTIAVTGTGLDRVYPAAHAPLAARIGACGVLVSEWPLGTPARAAHFPQRNRLIAGLAGGVLIVEAALRSGSLITARLANDMGREVFALPGSIHAPLSRGCHRLIRQGAQLVETPEEILQELAPQAAQPASAAHPVAVHTVRADAGCERLPAGNRCAVVAAGDASVIAGTHADTTPHTTRALTDTERAVLDALGHAPATLATLAHRTSLDDTPLHGALLGLELRGQLALLPGGWFVRSGIG